MKKDRILFLLILITLINFSSAELTCPIGLVNDSYPGNCGLYTDQNRDNICDYSQETANTVSQLNATELHDIISGQEIKTKTVGEVAEIYGICKTEYSLALSERYGFLITSGDNFTNLHTKGVQPSIAKTIAESMLLAGKTSEENIRSIETAKKPTREYYMWQITLILTSLYLTSLYLVKKQKIGVIKNRKFWNMSLLISFIITAISSIFLLIKINYGYEIFLINWAWWHIIFGYIMILISIFHTAWHIPYFKSYFRK